MSPDLIAIVIPAVVIGFPWNLYRGAGDHREHMVRFEGCTRRESPSA